MNQTVQNGAEELPWERYSKGMAHKKIQNKTTTADHFSVEIEMAKPRMARSARITELNLDTTRTREHPSTCVPGTVSKIIPSSRPGQAEEAQIAVARPKRPHTNFRIENNLTDEHGDDVKLEKGARVEVTVTAKAIKRHD
jgi:hypothetical protein